MSGYAFYQWGAFIPSSKVFYIHMFQMFLLYRIVFLTCVIWPITTWHIWIYICSFIYIYLSLFLCWPLLLSLFIANYFFVLFFIFTLNQLWACICAIWWLLSKLKMLKNLNVVAFTLFWNNYFWKSLNSIPLLLCFHFYLNDFVSSGKKALAMFWAVGIYWDLPINLIFLCVPHTFLQFKLCLG